MSLRGSSRRKVISISGAPEAFLVSGAKFFFLAADTGIAITSPFLLACVGRSWKEIGVKETKATSLHYSSSFFLLSLELPHQLPQIPCFKIYLDW